MSELYHALAVLLETVTYLIVLTFFLAIIGSPGMSKDNMKRAGSTEQ